MTHTESFGDIMCYRWHLGTYTLILRDYSSFATVIISKKDREIDITEPISASIKVIIAFTKEFYQ